MLNEIGKFLRVFLGISVQEQHFHTPVMPADMEALERAKLIDRRHMQENAYLKAQNLRLKEQLQKGKKQKERDKEETQISEYITKKKLINEKLKSMRAVRLKILAPVENTLFFKNKVPFAKLEGFILQDTPEGYTLWYPWVKHADGTDAKMKVGSFDFNQIFKEPINMAQQLKSGKVDSNYDHDGEKIVLLGDKKGSDKDGKQYKIINLSEQERREFELREKEIKEALNQAYNQLEQTEKVSRQQEISIAQQASTVNASTAERDIWAAAQTTLMQQQVQLIREVSQATVSVQDANARHVLEEELSKIFRNYIAKLDDYIEEKMPKDLRQIAKEDVMSDMAFATNLVEKTRKITAQTTPKSLPPPPPQPAAA